MTSGYRTASRTSSFILFALFLCLAHTSAWAQLHLWSEVVNGGVITGSYSLGTSTIGSGSFELPFPPGSTISRAVLYATEVGGIGDSSIVKVNTVPYVLNATNAGPFYNSPPYGDVVLHSIDLTAVLDPTVTTYTITIPYSEVWTNKYTEYYLIATYELPGAQPVYADVFFADGNSAANEHYTLNTSYPMLTAGGVAFGTMAGYSYFTGYDCEDITVNGTLLGTYMGGDFNAATHFGTTGNFFYSHDQFIGLGDDVADQAIHQQDVLSDISGLITDGATSVDVNYHHCPGGTDTDNLINLMVLAYTSDPCMMPFSLGPDTAFCGTADVVLDATRPGATYLWQDNSTNATFTAEASGTYSVEVNANGCTWRDTVVVNMKPLPEFELGADVNACEDDVIVLDASSLQGSSYLWQTGDTGPMLTADSAGTYHADAFLDGCTWSDSVRVIFDPCGFDIELPNVFTPNHDGTNSAFRPISVHGDASMHLSVFNRWGQEVFASGSASFAWNGTAPNGNDVPAGVYFWLLKYTVSSTGEAKELHGSVTVLR